MSTNDFDVGNLVWAKMKGFPAWPGKIIDPPADAKSPKQKKSQHYVYFFGSNNHAWIPDEKMVPHNDSMVQSAKKKNSSAYQSAIEAIVNLSKSAKREKTIAAKILKEKEQIANRESSEKKTPKQNKAPIQNKVLKQHKAPSQYKVPCLGRAPSKKSSQGKTPKQVKAPNQSKMPNSVNNVHKKRVKICIMIDRSVPVQRKTVKKRPLIDTHGAECPLSYPKTARVENDYADSFASVPPSMGHSHFDANLTHDSGYCHSSRILSRPPYIERPPTPVLDISNMSQSIEKTECIPCSKKIGFLGLGNIGQGIVKNLLNTGHHVTVWNRTPGKMEIFLEAGASRGQTPADVIQACDITFCCVSDCDAVKCIVFGNCGVLEGLDSCPDSNKGYVEMTSIDPETSKAVGDEITSKGGRYLEAPVAGSKRNAIEGSLSIVGAGNRELFLESETCFHAMGRNAFYISTVVGTGAMMNLIHSMLHGTCYAAMAESMALVQSLELSQSDFLKILKSGPFNCHPMLEKGHAILENNYLTNTPLKHIQKDINMALTLSASVDQYLPLAAAANEAYKYAKRLRYGDHDVSAVYMGAMYKPVLLSKC